MHLISYDIQNDRLRIKAAKLLIRYGLYRVQYSVFMGTLKESTERKIREGFLKLSSNPHWAPSDTILILPLHQYSSENLEVIGSWPEDWDLIQQRLHTLIL